MKDRQNLPIIVGGWACLIVWAALLGGCGTLGVSYDRNGNPDSLVFKVAQARPVDQATAAEQAAGNWLGAAMNVATSPAGQAVLYAVGLGGAAETTRRVVKKVKDNEKAAEDRGWREREEDHLNGKARIVSPTETSA